MRMPRQQAGATDAVLKHWKKVILSTSMHFNYQKSERSRYYEATNIREEICKAYVRMRITLLQRICDIAEFKKTLECERDSKGKEISNSKVAETYTTNINVSPDSDEDPPP